MPTNNNNNNNRPTGAISWILIVALYAFGLWPVATILIFMKLFAPDVSKSDQKKAPPLREEKTDPEEIKEKKKQDREETKTVVKDALKSVINSPNDTKLSSWLLMIFGIIVALFGLLAVIGNSADFSLGLFLFALSLIISGGAMTYGGFEMQNSIKRYANYIAVIGPNQAVEIESIAKKTGFKKRKVERDLQKMIDKGMFGPSAYLNKELGYIFMSTQADEELTRAREAAEKKAQILGQQEAAKQNADSYEQILYQIREANDRIPDPDMTQKIAKIEDITRQIFKAVEKEPEKKKKIDRFMSYYLPTTLKLLESYYNLQSTNIDGENITGSMQSIELAMDTIVDGFKKQLDDLYKTEAFSIDAEIDALTKIMGSGNTDFKVSPSNKEKEKQPTAVDLGGMAAEEK